MKDSDWEILYALYKKPNITKVANMLYMTQPSLTKRLQQMEKEFDVEIKEVLSRVQRVKAESLDDAINKAMDR